MSNFVILDIYTRFDGALKGFYQVAAVGISSYVVPVAWILLGICMLIWCYQVIEGKVALPITDWLPRFLGFLVALHVMGSGYLAWVAEPIFALPAELTTALSSSASGAPDLLGQVNEKVVDLVSAMFAAGSDLIAELAIGPAIALFLLGCLVIVATYLLLSVALFAIIFSKLGLSMVLAVGPLFLLALVLPQTRNYFHSWCSTCLYFILYHILSALFVFMFIGIVDSYVGTLNTSLGGLQGGGGVLNMVANLLGVRGPGLNVAAITIPIVLIAMVMFFMFLQIPAMCASLSGGGGGSFGVGVVALMQARSPFRRSKSGD